MDDVYVIAEEFCGGCGESMGWDLRPLTLLCPTCRVVEDGPAYPDWPRFARSYSIWDLFGTTPSATEPSSPVDG